MKLWTVKLQFELSFVLVGDSRQSNWTLPYTVQNAACALSIFVITNVNFDLFTCSAVFHTFVMNRNEFLHADGGLILHSAT